MEDQPLPADASPTALSPGYVVDSDPEKDEKDPEEDPAYYPADRGNNDEDESSNDDDDDDDIEKDEEDNEEEEHLALADPTDVSTDDLETMTTVNQGMSVEEIERVVAQRVVNAIEVIAIYETKTNIARKSMSQTKRQKEKVAENASNKRKWESNHNGSLSQQNKGHKVPRAHTAWPINKKAYAISLPLCNQCKFHHNGPCTISTLVKCQTKNKKRLDNTSKNNQNQQQPNKRQNTGRAYTARHGEKKHYGGSKPLCSKCYYHHDEMMTTVNQGMSVEEIKRVVAQRVANAIEAIAIYETKTNLAHKSMSQTERQEEKVVEDDSNKRMWESNHNGSLSQQNKGHKV
nr:hypothetical protein [Tanacetum cinerariifolium]